METQALCIGATTGIDSLSNIELVPQALGVQIEIKKNFLAEESVDLPTISQIPR